MCIILEKLPKPSILTFFLAAQNNRLQGDDPRKHPLHFFSFVNKKTALQLSKLEKLSHPSISILIHVLDAQRNRLDEAIPPSIHNMFSIINMKAKFQLLLTVKTIPPSYEALPRVLGNRGKGVFISGEQGNKNQILRGTGEQRQYCGTGNIRKTNFRFLGNRGTRQFISGEQGNRYPPPPGRASCSYSPIYQLEKFSNPSN